MDLKPIATLKKQGRFLEALNALETIGPSPTAAVCVQRAELLERLGRHDECRRLTEAAQKTKQLTASHRATCEYLTGHIDLEDGDTQRAVGRFQRAASLARGTDDLELLCRVQMKLLVVVADVSGPDAAAPILSDLRHSTTRLGDPHTTAALHVFVAEMEARRGLLHSAQKHLSIANGLMVDQPNPWLAAVSENIRLAACVLESKVDAGEVHAELGMRLAQESGTAVVRRAIAANHAVLHFVRGDFQKAVESLNRALVVLRSSGERRNGCLETLARIRLAEGRLDDCAAALDAIDASIKFESDRSQYANRYALLTRTHLLERQGFIDDALRQIDRVLDVAGKMDDRLLRSSASLTKIELLQTAGRSDEASNLLSLQPDELQSFSPELYVHYEQVLTSGLLLQNQRLEARTHYLRAQRLCNVLCNVPRQLELTRRWQKRVRTTTDNIAVSDDSSPGSLRTRDAIHTIAAITAHAGRGEFIAREIAELLVSTACVTSAVGLSVSAKGERTVLFKIGKESERISEPREQRLIVQSDGERTIEVVAKHASSVAASATLNAVAHLLATVRELEHARRDREERATIWPADELHLDDGSIVSGHMRELMGLAQRVARTTVNVLITGDSGTGKEIIARAIHNYSARAQKAFVPFNCAAVPRDLVESQLFGHRRGAFTGADRDYLGLIRAARDGTLFLDEIGDLSTDLQPKLLRFLESGEISPLGENSPIHVNVRIVAATNANLEDAVRDGRFREDLFYRLNVVRLSLKPLRERRDEIPGLVNHFVAQAAREFGKGRLEIAEETMERLLLYRWPGNVRQLQNELRRMVALAEPDSTLGPSSISDDILRAMPIFRSEPISGREIAVRLNDKLLPTLSRVECEMIKAALRENRGKVDAVARALGISRKGLYLKRQRLGL
jgi:transcriptional regulator with PAS, ATPase and Fis domain/tetratricopeptide (TPR) repeat protein